MAILALFLGAVCAARAGEGPSDPRTGTPAQGAAAAGTADGRWTNLPHTDTPFTPRTYPTLEAWNRRREHLRRQILWAAGLWPMPEKTPLNARVFDRVEHADYSVEKVYFESRPGLFVTGTLYRPKTLLPGGHPGVLNPHGHAATGRLQDNDTASYQARGITFARMGSVALLWDMVDYNDSALQLSGSYQEESYWQVHNRSWPQRRDRRALWNVNALGVQLWNSIRALDFLASLPEVDAGRLGCTGESGGGTQTFLLCAVEDRVKVAAPVCMVSAFMQGGCTCENAPGLRLDTCNVDFGAMMAPRPLLLVSSTRDWTRHTARVEYPAIRAVYGLFDGEDRLAHVSFDANHGYNRDMRNAVYPWFARWLSLPIPADFREPVYEPEPKENLLVFARSIPDQAIRDHEGLVDAVVAAAAGQVAAVVPATAEGREANRALFGEGLRLSAGVAPCARDDIEYVARGDAALDGLRGESGFLRDVRRDVPVPVWVFRPAAAVSRRTGCVLLVHGGGRAALASRSEWVGRWLALGQTVYAVEIFGIGDARPAEETAGSRGSTRFFTTFNRTDDAERVYDLTVALGYCQWHGADGAPPEAVHAIGFGKAGPWLAVAGAVHRAAGAEPAPIRFAIDANRFPAAAETSYLEDLFLPGILRAGGLANAIALLAPSPLLLHNTGGTLDTSRAVLAYEDTAARLQVDTAPRSDEACLRFLVGPPTDPPGG
ncbi:MAG: acetylxylan esterase [Lentisphaeria bacterium]|nr:acetylxylan esterase [Lentisphaeria bacterium]